MLIAEVIPIFPNMWGDLWSISQFPPAPTTTLAPLQKLHLPPELSETVSRSQEEDQAPGTAGGGGRRRKPISLSTAPSTRSNSTDSTAARTVGVASSGERSGKTGGSVATTTGSRTKGSPTPGHGSGPRTHGKLSSHHIDFWIMRIVLIIKINVLQCALVLPPCWSLCTTAVSGCELRVKFTHA